MSSDLVRIIVFAVLFLHGIAHGGAIGAMFWVEARPDIDAGGWKAAKSWIIPSLSPSVARTVAIVFWAVSMLGFVIAALGFLDFLVPASFWRGIAVGSAVISTVGILLFLVTWPPFNTMAALAVNLAVFITQLWLRWPPQ
ncbi:MAG TPA: hypothetical protein VFZ76_16595 [Anaerolineales bacterium]